MSDDPNFNKRLSDLEAQGKQRFGDEGWSTTIAAVGRAVGSAGISRPAMDQILQQADPAAFLNTAGREQLIREASEGNRESDMAYSAMRDKERQAWRKLKGRI